MPCPIQHIVLSTTIDSGPFQRRILSTTRASPMSTRPRKNATTSVTTRTTTVEFASSWRLGQFTLRNSARTSLKNSRTRVTNCIPLSLCVPALFPAFARGVAPRDGGPCPPSGPPPFRLPRPHPRPPAPPPPPRAATHANSRPPARPPPGPDREPQLPVHPHRRDQLHVHRHVVPRHHHLHPRRQRADPRHVRRPKIELRPVPVEIRRVPPPLFLRQHIYLRLEFL